MSDYMFVLESHLDAVQNKIVTEMQRIATHGGMNLWLTGGAMRDVLRGSRILDLDFSVERDAIRLGRALVEICGGKVLSEDALKRWIELDLVGGVRASVSNLRTEKYSKPGGKPQITPASIHEDLIRRDFTINAMALSLNRGSRGLLVDPTNGQADLTNRELRTTNSYAMFDDPSRIFRLIRFQHVLGFTVSPRTQSQLENALLEGYEKAASVAALATEIRALSGSENAVAGLEAFDGLGLLKLLSPALTGPRLNTQGLTKLEKLAHGVLPFGTRGGWLAFLSVLTEKMSPREKADAIRAFELNDEEAGALRGLDTGAKKLESTLKSARITRPSHVYDSLAEATADEILMVLYSSTQRVVQDRIRAYYQKYLPLAQEVTEDQVTAAGFKPGTPKFEKAFRSAIAAHINARPKKVPPPEPEPLPAPAPMAARSGSRK